jgi:hypothetical protein
MPGTLNSARRARQTAARVLTSGCPQIAAPRRALYAGVRRGGLGMLDEHKSIEEHRFPVRRLGFDNLFHTPHEPPRRQRDIL